MNSINPNSPKEDNNFCLAITIYKDYTIFSETFDIFTKEGAILFFVKNYIIVFMFCVISFFVIFQTYKSGVLNVMFTTGRILCSTILNAEIDYYSHHHKFKYINRTSFDEDLMIDSRNNLFFPSFSVYKLDNNKSAISVFGVNDLKNYELILEFDDNSSVTSAPQKLKVKVVKHKLK